MMSATFSAAHLADSPCLPHLPATNVLPTSICGRRFELLGVLDSNYVAPSQNLVTGAKEIEQVCLGVLS